MAANGLLQDLASFFKAARHLWGRCPRCDYLFRLSDAAISASPEAPSDWLKKLQRDLTELDARRDDIQQWQAEVDAQESDLKQRERQLDQREKNLDRDARARAREMLREDSSIKKLITEARREAVQRSRSTLLGNLFERLGPFLQRFEHDPRDIRPIMNPCDYVCFDGLTVSRRVERITFVEVKTGTSTPSPTQRSIMKAVQEGRVTTEVWQFGARGIPIPQQLLLTAGSKSLPPGRAERRKRPR